MNKAVKEYLDKIPRQDKIEKLANQVEGWDMDSLVDFAVGTLSDRYEGMCDDDLDEEYYAQHDYEIDCELEAACDDSDDVYEDDDDDDTLFNEEDECRCPNLFLDGHVDGCSAKRS